MPLINSSSGKTIYEKARPAKGFYGKFKGLMFESRKNFDYALVFDMIAESRLGSSIHMLFVFFPIDAVFLDSKKQVVDIALNLRPFALSFVPKKPAKFIIELPAGKTQGIKLGDKLDWNFQ